MRRSWLLVPALAGLSCGAGAPPSRPSPPPPPPRAEAIPLVRPARYLVPDAAWVERTADGLDRVVINGRRLEVRGVETTRMGPPEPEIHGGAMAPSWAGSGPCRYVFWKGRELFCAETFTAELHKLVTLPVEPERAFDWLDGTGIRLPGGAIVVPVAGGAPVKLTMAAAGNALAADARRAVVVTALGHVLLTVDGGKSFRDASAELGPASSLLVRGNDLVVVQSEGRGESLINSSGVIADARSGRGVRRGEPPDDETDLWPRHAEGALRAAVSTGLPLPDGGAVITTRGFVGRLDLATLRTTSVATLEGIAPKADCYAFRAADATLLACADHERASVIDISGAPRLERTFDLTGAPDGDRFAGFDGSALGYLGACDGHPAKASRRDGEGMFGPEAYDGPPPRSAVFCVRVNRDEWVEHRLDPGDAGDVVAWIPRPSGGAVAIVARAGTVLPDAERVTVRGGLRVVRVARNEPPFAFPQWGYRPSMVLNRGLRVGADDVIEGWFPASMGSQSVVSVTIDAAGRARAYASPPRANQIVTAGRTAIAQGEDGRLFETVDAGHHWAEVEPPPGAPFTYPSQCSPVGCQVGSFVRIGWAGTAGDGAAPDPMPAKGRSARERGGYMGRQTTPPLVRLACSFEGPADGQRTSDAYGFGATAWAQPRGAMPMRLGSVGVAMFPWNGPQPVLSGDVDLAWVSPLDLAGRIRRTTISLGRAGINTGNHRVYEVKLGYIVDAAGGLDVIATGHRDGCIASLLDVTGITRSLGGCAEDPAVGVDLGGKVVVVHAAYDALFTLAADAPPRRKDAANGEEGAKKGAKGAGPAPTKGAATGKPGAAVPPAGSPVSAGSPVGGLGPAERVAPALPPIPVAIRELTRTPLGVSTRGFSYGAGVRDGAPVVVAVDQGGAAFLALIDPERGTLSAEEPLRALTSLALGSDASCAGARPSEARVALPFDSEIGLDRASLRGILATGTSGIAVLRWSRDRACLDAVELSVRDERFDADLGPYDPPGSLRKLTARFTGAGVKAGGAASLLLIANGMELRQPVTCKGLVPGAGEGD